MPSNEKGMFSDIDLNHRLTVTKVRGGWNENKIKKELKGIKTLTTESSFYKEIMKYDTPEEFAENLCYHGSGNSIGVLKPSIVLGNTESFGGGYGEKYYGVSLSKDKNIASNFTGASRFGNVAPVLIRRGAVMKEMPEIRDSDEINEIIVDLWTEGVDAVVIGDHSKEHSEQEVVVLNPRCLAVGKPEGFAVFQKKKMPSMTKEELTELWLNSSDLYKTAALKSWDNQNEAFKAKHGREKDPAGKWNSKQENLFNYHKHNVELYHARKLKKDDVDQSVETSIQNFLDQNKPKEEKVNKKKRTIRPS